LVVEVPPPDVSGLGKSIHDFLQHVEGLVGRLAHSRTALALTPVLTAILGSVFYGIARHRRKKMMLPGAALQAGDLGKDTDTWSPGSAGFPMGSP